MLLDTHCHLTHERYRDDLPDVLARAQAAGVEGVVAIASNLKDASDIAEVVKSVSVPWIRGTAGIHPHEANDAPSDLEAALTRSLTEHSGIVAIGECGLDYHYDFSPKPKQRQVFEVHMKVAESLGLPLVVHCREAEDEMKGWVEDAGEAGVRGVLHCFPGHLGLMEVAMEAGWMVSFTGLVTFRSFEGADAVRTVPRGRYMLETDGPYMAPVPHRGSRNEPAFVPRIRDRVAELRGVAPDEVEAETTEAARDFFQIAAA